MKTSISSLLIVVFLSGCTHGALKIAVAPDGPWIVTNDGAIDRADRVPLWMLHPRAHPSPYLCVLAHPEGHRAFLDKETHLHGLARALLDLGHTVVLFDAFLTGTLQDPQARQARRHFQDYFTTYNRTDLQERIDDVMNVCRAARTRHQPGPTSVVLCGIGQAGLWALLAWAGADAVIADADALDTSLPANLLDQDLFMPGLSRYGGFDGAGALAAPRLRQALAGRTGTPGVLWGVSGDCVHDRRKHANQDECQGPNDI